MTRMISRSDEIKETEKENKTLKTMCSVFSKLLLWVTFVCLPIGILVCIWYGLPTAVSFTRKWYRTHCSTTSNEFASREEFWIGTVCHVASSMGESQMNLANLFAAVLWAIGTYIAAEMWKNLKSRKQSDNKDDDDKAS
eukprot:CAMPEP_0167744956 /NCGR_PEP_ID=MMETSP0110_2-20121227/2882_1 /TAXON_ID=629695 /ORGANISM="Gymnochlora sp., Strain CCMP2014" /LENGTH=138 /DNA_ID=CAMNT_0007629541 /DNA_START=52 /DNA_END=468 /DNA_ORIENTATION=+